MKLRPGDRHVFSFFNDSAGRLRATWIQMGVTKPIESAAGKRYQFEKVFGLYNAFSENDYWELQLATDGQTVTVMAL